MWKMFAASTTSWTSRTIPPSTSTWQGCLVLLVIIILVLLIFIIIIQQIFGVHKWCLGTERRRTAARCQSQVWKPSSRSFSAGFSLIQNVQIKTPTICKSDNLTFWLQGLIWFLRINVSRNARRQMRFGDQKVSWLTTRWWQRYCTLHSNVLTEGDLH